MPARYHQIRRGSVGFQPNSSVEVIGDGPGAENTMYCGEYNVVDLYVNFNKGSSTTTIGMRPYWSTDGMTFYQKCFITESNAFTLPSVAQVITIPSATFNYVIELPVHGPHFRLGFTFTDVNAQTAVLSVQAVPRLR